MSKQPTYAEQQQELQEVLARFEASAHEDVEELLKDYEAASALIASLEKQLQKATLKIEKATKAA